MSTQQLIDISNGMYVPTVSLVDSTGSALSTLTVTGKTAMVAATVTRPADTTAYTALDAVSGSTSAPALITFSSVARIEGGSGYITKARLMTDQASCTARFRLNLYHTAPSAIADNSPFAELWVNRSSRVGYIDFDACATEGTGSTAASSLNASLRLAFICASPSTTLYGMLEAKDGFAPTSAQNFYVELTAEQN